jgi:hypothetical protein
MISAGFSPTRAAGRMRRRLTHMNIRRNIAMSLAEIERFAADLRSNEALRAEAETAQAETLQATPTDHVADRMAAFAATKGYAFTADEARAYAKARKLADGELDGVVGGAGIAAAALGIDQGKLEVGKAAAKSYGDQFSNSGKNAGH